MQTTVVHPQTCEVYTWLTSKCLEECLTFNCKVRNSGGSLLMQDLNLRYLSLYYIKKERKKKKKHKPPINCNKQLSSQTQTSKFLIYIYMTWIYAITCKTLPSRRTHISGMLLISPLMLSL